MRVKFVPFMLWGFFFGGRRDGGEAVHRFKTPTHRGREGKEQGKRAHAPLGFKYVTPSRPSRDVSANIDT